MSEVAGPLFVEIKLFWHCNWARPSVSLKLHWNHKVLRAFSTFLALSQRLSPKHQTSLSFWYCDGNCSIPGHFKHSPVWTALSELDSDDGGSGMVFLISQRGGGEERSFLIIIHDYNERAGEGPCWQMGTANNQPGGASSFQPLLKMNSTPLFFSTPTFFLNITKKAAEC